MNMKLTFYRFKNTDKFEVLLPTHHLLIINFIGHRVASYDNILLAL